MVKPIASSGAKARTATSRIAHIPGVGISGAGTRFGTRETALGRKRIQLNSDKNSRAALALEPDGYERIKGKVALSGESPEPEGPALTKVRLAGGEGGIRTH